MNALLLLACSGPWAYRVIMEAQIYAATLVLVSWGIVALSVGVAWFRRPAIDSAAVLLGMMLIHPGSWMIAGGGDCGSGLRACSTIWTILLGISGVVVICRSWQRRRQQTSEEITEM